MPPVRIRGTADAEDTLAQYLDLANLGPYERQYGYVPGRKFRADFAFPTARVLVEVQGGVYTRKAHGSITGILKDIERGNLAALHGWRVLRYTTQQIMSASEIGDVLEEIERAISGAQ